MGKIRVLLADDHTLFREGLYKGLSSVKDIDCVAMAKDGEEAIRLATEFQPDVALIDIAMPGIDGIDATKQIKKICPKTAILIVTAHIDDEYLFACMEAGVNGFLPKTVSIANLIEAIRLAHAGESVFTMEATSKVVRRLATREKKAGFGELHAREMEVLRLVAKGMSNKEIASELCVSDWTIATHLANILGKLGVKSRMEATFYALKQGWLTIDDLG